MGTTRYEEMQDWPGWRDQAKVCRQLVNKKGVTPRTIGIWRRKHERMLLEASVLFKKIQERCKHPLTHQVIKQYNTSLCEWNDHYVDSYVCTLCDKTLTTRVSS